MKKIFLFSLLLSIVLGSNAQTKFSVPVPNMEQKYNSTRALLYNNILALINIAKSDGMTADELGKKSGALFFPYWDEHNTFEQYVNFSLSSWAFMSDSVKIIEQSNEKVVFTFPHIYPALESQGVLVGSSLEDLIAYFDALMGAIAKRINLSCDITWGEEGMKTEIAKK
jgi:hypothetical protein